MVGERLPPGGDREILGEPGGRVGRTTVLVTAALAFGGELLGIGDLEEQEIAARPDGGDPIRAGQPLPFSGTLTQQVVKQLAGRRRSVAGVTWNSSATS